MKINKEKGISIILYSFRAFGQAEASGRDCAPKAHCGQRSSTFILKFNAEISVGELLESSGGCSTGKTSD